MVKTRGDGNQLKERNLARILEGQRDPKNMDALNERYAQENLVKMRQREEAEKINQAKSKRA